MDTTWRVAALGLSPISQSVYVCRTRPKDAAAPPGFAFAVPRCCDDGREPHRRHRRLDDVRPAAAADDDESGRPQPGDATPRGDGPAGERRDAHGDFRRSEREDVVPAVRRARQHGVLGGPRAQPPAPRRRANRVVADEGPRCGAGPAAGRRTLGKPRVAS